MNRRVFVLLIFVLSILIGCGEDNPTNSSKSPEITSILPDSAKVGDLITIAGINFGIVQDTSYITFHNIRAIEITSWTDKEIKLNVPDSAISGKVSITVNTIKSNEVDFTVIKQDLFESVTIGSQVWMKRNLEVEFYRNGDSIRYVDSFNDWVDAGNKKEGAWSYYNNDSALGAVYGKLYNWYAVNDPRKLAPKGWHIPSNTEWTLLSDYLGGFSVAGGKMKETDTIHWSSPNTGATNSSGFTALPGGRCFYNGYSGLKKEGFWWLLNGDDKAWSTFLLNNTTKTSKFYTNENIGYSVRCIKD